MQPIITTQPLFVRTRSSRSSFSEFANSTRAEDDSGPWQNPRAIIAAPLAVRPLETDPAAPFFPARSFPLVSFHRSGIYRYRVYNQPFLSMQSLRFRLPFW